MKRVYPLLSLFFFMILFCFACFHTWEVDEAWTYVSVRDESFTSILAYAHFNIANNHVLNSLWFKLMQMAGCRNVIFFRMASLAAFWLYSYYLYRLVRWMAPDWKPACDWWLVLFFLPPIMVYFTLGRGYGMATAFFVASLYYMTVWLSGKKEADYWKAFAFGALSCLSIVSFLFPFLAMLIYMVFSSNAKLFSKRNLITGLLLLPLFLYIYYVGKTILLHDKIINGTDNLIVNGMYSTFVGALSIYDYPFPSLQWLDRIHAVDISKFMVLLSLIPVCWILLRKRNARYPQLIILLIMTLLFLATHLLLKTKYPSDRSVIYIFYLLYIPVVLYIALYRNPFFLTHYFIVLLFSLVNFYSFFYSLFRPQLYAQLKQLPVKNYTIVSDWPNYADQVYDSLYFDNRLHFSYVAQSFEKDWDSVDKRIKAVLQQQTTDYLLLQRSTWLRDKAMFAPDQPAQRLFSSSYKEMYLIRLR